MLLPTTLLIMTNNSIVKLLRYISAHTAHREKCDYLVFYLAFLHLEFIVLECFINIDYFSFDNLSLHITQE